MFLVKYKDKSDHKRNNFYNAIMFQQFFDGVFET